MVKEKAVFYEDFGKVIYRRKRGIKRLTVRIKPSGELFVTVPFLVGFNYAETFLMSKKDWILRQYKKLSLNSHDKLLINDLTEYHTCCHTLKIIRADSSKLSAKLSFPYLKVFIPIASNIESNACQQFIKRAIIETYRKEAIESLPVKIQYYSNLYDLSYAGVKIKKMKSRWGSCSGKNIISLNLFLMMLPEYLRDYVVLHELMHTVEKNHGDRFWNKLENICPEAKKFRREIKKFRIDRLTD